MLLHRNATHVLIALAALFMATSCASLNPAHLGRFTFQGTVTNEAGKPVPNAWVKVRGWETLTDSKGKWQQVQVVDCGTLRDHMDSFEENDAILVTADGYQPSEENFVIKHPGYFQGCKPEQTIVLDSVLKAESAEVQTNKIESRKTNPPKESPEMPWPSPRQRRIRGKKGAYTL